MRALKRNTVLAAAMLLGLSVSALAERPAGDPSHPATTVTAAAPGGSAEGAQGAGKLVFLFGLGVASLDAHHEELLDKASRLYREGRPIIMIVSGSADATGSSEGNLLLSQRRADAVAHGLLERGIPAERTQILAKGETNPEVPTDRGVPEAQNRRVEVTWR